MISDFRATIDGRRAPAASVLVAAWLILPGGAAAAERKAPDYLEVVRAYADALIDHGRDRYGPVRSPLFATTLDRRTLRLCEGDRLAEVKDIPREGWGIRPHDRMPTGANSQHHQNLYQVLYALTEVTGEPRYAEAADAALAWFFRHCQSEATGLFAWGEHIGRDFLTEKPTGNTHEYFRPWVLWERSYALAPQACERFARGVWEHQIGDPSTGNFSRHARYDRHGPGKDSQYPRHGGFYIGTWAAAYEHTGDPVFLTAIETLVDYFDGRRSPTSGAIPAESHPRSKGLMIWPGSNLSLAVDLEKAAGKVPGALAAKLRRNAAKCDEVFLKIEHDLSPGGKGFVGTAHTHTLAVQGYSKGVWRAGYGVGNDASFANLCLLRYRQAPRDGYRKLVLDTAARYLEGEPDAAVPLHPGTFGNLVFLMLGAHEITGRKRYLDSAHRYAGLAVETFVGDGSPLPKATSRHDHYEAITLGDTMMMALVQLWAIENRPGQPVRLVYCDR